MSVEVEIESVRPGQLGHEIGWQSMHVGELITTVYGGERPFRVEDDDE